MRAQEGTIERWKHKGLLWLTSPFYRCWMHQAALAPWKTKIKRSAAQNGWSTVHNESFHWTLWTWLYGSLLSFKKVSFENKESHSIQFWSTKKHKAEKPQVIMRLSLHGPFSMDNLVVTIQQRVFTDCTAWTASTSTYLSIWPIVLRKDSIIGVHCPIGNEHDGLDADASLSCVVELWEEISSNWKTHERALYICETSEAWGLGLRKAVKTRAHSASPKQNLHDKPCPTDGSPYSLQQIGTKCGPQKGFLKKHTRGGKRDSRTYNLSYHQVWRVFQYTCPRSWHNCLGTHYIGSRICDGQHLFENPDESGLNESNGYRLYYIIKSRRFWTLRE